MLWDFHITVNDIVIQTAEVARSEDICTAVFQYKEFIVFGGELLSKPVSDGLYSDDVSVVGGGEEYG